MVTARMPWYVRMPGIARHVEQFLRLELDSSGEQRASHAAQCIYGQPKPNQAWQYRLDACRTTGGPLWEQFASKHLHDRLIQAAVDQKTISPR